MSKAQPKRKKSRQNNNHTITKSHRSTCYTKTMTRLPAKEISIVIAVLILNALLFWRLNTMDVTSFYVFVLTSLVILSILWIALVVISLGLIRNKAIAALLIIIIPLTLIVVGGAHIGVVGAALILTVILLTARARSKEEIANRINYSTAQIFNISTRLIFIGLIVGMAGLYMPAINSAFNSEEIVIPEQPIRIVLKPFEQLIRNSILSYSSQATVDQLMQNQLEQQLNGLPPGTVITPEQKEQALQGLSKQLGQPLSGEENIAQVVTSALNKQINNLVKQSPLLATLSVILFIVMVARFVSSAFVWPLRGVIALIIFIARKTDFVQLISSEEPVERLWL